MPLIVPPPWTCVADVQPADVLRFRLTWTRPVQAGESPAVIGVVMYNPAMEGSALPDGSTLDGATHRRVRALLAAYSEIRVANLSPVRTTKPDRARKLCADLPMTEHRLDQRHAIRWACEAPVVVAAWGAGARTERMAWSLELVREWARDRIWCWGTTPAGDPLHPSPLGRVPAGAELQPFGR